MGRKCEFFWCSNHYGESIGKIFYSFPKDYALCYKWVLHSGSSEAADLFRSQGPNAFRKKKICSDHFRPEVFRDPVWKEKGLLPEAFPQQCFPYGCKDECPRIGSDNEFCDDGKRHDLQYIREPAVIFEADKLPEVTKRNLTNRPRFEENQDGSIDFLEGDADFIEWQTSINEPSSIPDEEPEISVVFETATSFENSLHNTAMVMVLENCPSSSYSTAMTTLPSAAEAMLASEKNNSLDSTAMVLESCPSLSYSTTMSTLPSAAVAMLASEKINSLDSTAMVLESCPSLSYSTTISALPSAAEAMLATEKMNCRTLKGKLKKARRELFVANQTSERRLQSINKHKLKVFELKKELRSLNRRKTANEKLGEKARNNPIINDSLHNAQRKPRGRRYQASTMKFAAGAYLSGPRAYRYMRNSQYLVFPHKSSVYRHNKHIRIAPGLNHNILAQTKRKVRSIKPKHHKIVTVCLDGMSIKSELTFCAKADTFHGFPDNGILRKVEKNDVMRLATEAVAVMVSGLYKRFKQPIGYFLAYNSLGSQEQFKVLKKSIRAVRDCGLIPLVVAMDQCSTNTKMIRDNGATPKNPFLDIDGEKVAVMFDTPHLTKNAINAIFKYNAVFDNKIALFVHIKELYDAEIISGLKLTPKLKEKNIKLPPFAAMNVALATRTLSESCSIGIRYYVQERVLPPEALQTAEFMSLHDKLFDVFNSKEIYSDSVGKAKRESQALKAPQRQPHYLKGFIGNIRALRWLWKVLRKTFQCKFLCTNPLCQDCLENFFAEIRRRCGFNDTPNAFQFGSAFKYAMIAATEGNFDDGRNCQADKCNPLLNEDDLEDFTLDTPVRELHYKADVLNLDVPFVALKKDLNALVYVIGAALCKIPHEKCRKKLTAERDDECLQNEDYQFVKLKASFSQRQVTIPNNTLYAIGLFAFVSFKLKFRRYLYENRKFVKSRLIALITYDSFDFAVCKTCFHKLLDVIFNTLIQGFLGEIRHQHKILARANRGRKKRNRKATRMNLPEAV